MHLFTSLILILLLVTAVPAVDGASRLFVSSVPPGAEVSVNGSVAGTTPVDLPRPPGTYAVALSLDGYEPYGTTVALDPEENRSVEVLLQASPGAGTLRVTSVPDGAEVSLDGTVLGRTPYTSGRVDAGVHDLALQREGYERYTERITVLAGRLTRVDAVLVRTPTTGILSVLSSPAGASVRIDGVDRGETPYEGRGFTPGTHLVELRREGYWDYRVQAIVAANQRTEVFTALEPLPSPGRLIITSDPSGARVLLDGTIQALTPATLEAPPGIHEVRVEADGYREETVRAQVVSGNETPIHVTLLPATPTPGSSLSPAGAVRIVSAPPGAAIIVDGEQRGVAPRTVRDLATGEHQLVLTLPGYAPGRETIFVQ
ncbi:MAG TPA: PEGA domain-containing protein, partial [Methanoregulaceae archaeon]|nr:PEGA domain-containing protein [Methanoregulaceae archaeon]